MKMPITDRRAKSQRQRGNAMVEFAISSVLLTSLFVGTFQFGYAFFAYNSLVTSVRGATRYASVRALANNNDSTVPSAFASDVRNMAVFGTITPPTGTQPVAPGLSTANIIVSVQFDAARVPRKVTVNVNNYSLDAIFRTFTFNGKPALTMPYLGSYCSGGTSCP